ncbi:MAG: RNA polymerase sigma factor [Christensenellales bacterium]
MDDSKIVDLYWERSETAINETSKKYSRYCHYISFNILHNNEDAEECVNDTYLRAWNAMPTKRPNVLSTFLGKITRNLSFDRFKQYNAEKRGFGQVEQTLSELDECVPSVSNVEQEIDEKVLEEALNGFLQSLPKQKRKMFVQRYWYLMSIKEIAEDSNTSESQIKSMLFRERKTLKSILEKEGVIL